MTNVQLYITIGIPTLAVLIGILLNGFLYNAINTGLNSRMGILESRMLSLETTMTACFDLLMGKLMEMDSRLSVLEDRGKS
jgi:hypothetical protein